MKWDKDRLLVSEIWPEYEGPSDSFSANRGDSMANTSRCEHLFQILKSSAIALDQFITYKGYVRHPSEHMPLDWRETDSPSDQCLPFYIAANTFKKDEMFARIKKAGWKTGNGDLVSPIFFAVLKDSTWMLNLALVGQLAIFKLPIRWSDSKHSLELSANSSADVLNWFHASCMASPWVRKLVSKDWIKEKITAYFKDEPNSSWLVELYKQAIDIVYKGA